MKTITMLLNGETSSQCLNEAVCALDKISSIYKINFNLNHEYFGLKSINESGFPISQKTVLNCQNSDAILLCNISPEFDLNVAPQLSTYRGFNTLKTSLGANVCLSNVQIYEKLSNVLLNSDSIKNTDIIFLKIADDNIYNDLNNNVEKITTIGQKYSQTSSITYNEDLINKLAKISFEKAYKRKRRVCCVLSKELSISELVKKIFNKHAFLNKDISLSFMNIDDCAFEILKNPKQFDVISCGNIFGDILIKEASFLLMSKSMVSSVYLGQTNIYAFNFDENLASNSQNPIGIFLSLADILLYSFDNKLASDSVKRAVKTVLSKGYRTYDIYSRNIFEILSTTSKMIKLIINEIN